MNTYLCYRVLGTGNEELVKQDIRCIIPSPKDWFTNSGGGNLKSLLVRIVFWIESFGKAKIYYCLADDGLVIHTSYIHPKTVKFPFLGSDDYVIGPCQTAKTFRGLGYYPRVLKHIAALPEYAGRNIYIFVNKGNHASIRGIEKAGFEFCGTLVCEGIFKRYKWLKKN